MKKIKNEVTKGYKNAWSDSETIMANEASKKWPNMKFQDMIIEFDMNECLTTIFVYKLSYEHPYSSINLL